MDIISFIKRIIASIKKSYNDCWDIIEKMPPEERTNLFKDL